MNLYLDLFLTFFKIGAFTIGGGYAMLPLIQAEAQAHGWMSEANLVNFVAVSESTPGPLAVNFSTYIGRVTGGFFGSLCATLGVVLPSFLIILLIARCYKRFQSSKIVSGCMSGLRPAVIGLIATSVLSVGQTVFFPGGFRIEELAGFSFLLSLAVFLFALFLAFKKKSHPILIICLSAVIGIAAGYIQIWTA